MANLADLDSFIRNEPKFLCVVRVTTSAWENSGALYIKKTIKTLKRKSVEYGRGFIHDECSNCGVEEFYPRIINFDTVKDGVYELALINLSRDFETGYVDDFDLELRPYND